MVGHKNSRLTTAVAENACDDFICRWHAGRNVVAVEGVHQAVSCDRSDSLMMNLSTFDIICHTHHTHMHVNLLHNIVMIFTFYFTF